MILSFAIGYAVGSLIGFFLAVILIVGNRP